MFLACHFKKKQKTEVTCFFALRLGLSLAEAADRWMWILLGSDDPLEARETELPWALKGVRTGG